MIGYVWAAARRRFHAPGDPILTPVSYYLRTNLFGRDKIRKRLATDLSATGSAAAQRKTSQHTDPRLADCPQVLWTRHSRAWTMKGSTVEVDG